MFFSRLADTFVLYPTRHRLPTEGKARRLVEFGRDQLEVWTQRTAPSDANGNATSREPELFILKLPGQGGRAERASAHPGETWSESVVEVWAFNPPGYGGSGGQATLKTFWPATQAVFRALEREAASRPIVVTGNSLGTATALALAAEHAVAGLVLRNPPPLRELIVGEYGWWNLSLAARLVARHIPRELDSIANAARASAPAVFICAARDRLVPPRYQQRIVDAYGEESRVVTLAQADHADLMQEHETVEYNAHLRWLRERVATTGRQTR